MVVTLPLVILLAIFTVLGGSAHRTVFDLLDGMFGADKVRRFTSLDDAEKKDGAAITGAPTYETYGGAANYGGYGGRGLHYSFG